jgi:hypothetical protein
MTTIRTGLLAKSRCPAPLLGAVCVLLLGPLPASAAPRDELLRLVPEDVTFCVVLQDLRAHTDAAREALEKEGLLPFPKGFPVTPELQKLLQVQEMLKELGITFNQLREDILGDAVVFAYRKGVQPQDDPEQALFLIWARDPKLLGRLIDRVNAMQKETGELREVREEVFRGRSYQHRVHAAEGKRDEFYSVGGNLFAFATSETMMHAALALDQDAPSIDKELPPLTRRLQRLAVDKALLSWWLNPRSFEADLTERQKIAKGGEKAFLDQFLPYWRATEGIAFFMSADQQQAELGLSIRVEKSKLPAAAQRFLTEAAQPSLLWQAIPEDVLLAIASRFDVASFIETAAGFLEPQADQAIRSGLESALGPFFGPPEGLSTLKNGVGPDWGFWAFGPVREQKERNWFPQLVLAIKLRDSDEGARTGDLLLDGLHALAAFVRLSNSQIMMGKEKDGQVEIRYLTAPGKALPAGLRPAYATKGGYLIVAGNPETIRRFQPPTAPLKPADENPLLRISLKAWRDYLSEHRSELAGHFAETGQTNPAAALNIIDELTKNLRGLDALEVVLKSQADQASLMIRLKAQPMK